jgi:uncharacterized protein (TIGR03435 family)
MRRILRLSFLLSAFGCSLLAQPADLRPAFEVASVKVTSIQELAASVRQGVRFGMNGGPGTSEPGRFTGNGVPLVSLIQRAYGLKRYQVRGPTSIDSQLYNIAAKVPEGTTKEQFALMIQRLLEERFKLSMHRESKEQPVYELTVAKSGPRLTESVETLPTADGAPPDAKPAAAAAKITFDAEGYPIIPPGVKTHMAVRGGRITQVWTKTTMGEFVHDLSGHLERPVIDATGLEGRYDITLHYVEELSRNGGPALAATDAGPTFAGAVQSQLGLKLESKKAMIEIFVVDHVESVPIAN